MAERELVLKITVDDAGGAAKIQAFNESLKQNETVAKTAADAEKRLDQAFKDADKSVAQMDKAVGKLGQTQQTTTRETDALTSAVARYASIGAVAGAARATLSFADTLQDTSARLGLTTTEFQRLDYAARQLGGTGESVARMMTTLTERIGAGETGTLDAVKRLGLSFEQLANQSPERSLQDISEALRALPSRYEQAAAAQDLFGRSGKDNIPFLTADLKELGDTAQETGQVLEESMVQSLANANDAIDNMTRSGKVLLGSVLTPLVPAFEQAANAASRLAGIVTNTEWGRMAVLGAVQGVTGMPVAPSPGSMFNADNVPKPPGAPRNPWDTRGLSRLAAGGAATAIPAPSSVQLKPGAGVTDVPLLPSTEFNAWDTGFGGPNGLNPMGLPGASGTDLNLRGEAFDAETAAQQSAWDQLAAEAEAASQETLAALQPATAAINQMTGAVNDGAAAWVNYRMAANAAMKILNPPGTRWDVASLESEGKGIRGGLGLVGSLGDLSGGGQGFRSVLDAQSKGMFGQMFNITIDAKGAVGFDSDASMAALADKLSRVLAQRLSTGTKLGA